MQAIVICLAAGMTLVFAIMLTPFVILGGVGWLVYQHTKSTPLLPETPPRDETTNTLDIPLKTYASHGIILAPPNHGKSQLLSFLIANFLIEPQQPGIILLDPHGDLFNSLKDRVDPDRLIILDPDTDPPALNFLDFGNSTEAQTLETFKYLMASLSGGLSDKQDAIVPYMLKLLRVIPDASLETLRQIVDEKAKTARQSNFYKYIEKLPTVDQGFFQNQFYSGRMQETKDSIGWKLYAALSSETFREMFSAQTNSFDADAIMRDSKVVLVKGSRRSLGEQGMQVFLQFIVAQFYSAALRRETVRHRPLSILCVDEAHHVFNSQTSDILVECRKFGLGFLAATQVVQQIPDDVKAAIYGATAIKIAGPVSHSDATMLAREMHTKPEFIRALKSYEGSHAEWAFYVQNITNNGAEGVNVPFGYIENLPRYPQRPRLPKPAAAKPREIETTRTALKQDIPQSDTTEYDTKH